MTVVMMMQDSISEAIPTLEPEGSAVTLDWSGYPPRLHSFASRSEVKRSNPAAVRGVSTPKNATLKF